MGSWTICITWPEAQDGEICWPVPLLIHGPPEISAKWISDGVIDPPYVKDLPILNTIDYLTSMLSNDAIRKNLQTATRGGLKQPALKGVKINFKGF